MSDRHPPSTKPRLIVILGPTAAGKTQLSLELANQLDGEIISGDSMQVYQGMDIGTAKVSPAERAQVPHHLINIKSPSESFSVSEFQQLANEAISEISARGRIPIVVGGTGLYIESLCYNFQMNEAGEDRRYRQQLVDYAEQHGSQALYDQLQRVDPAAAARIHPNDQRRLIRALEVTHLTGKPFSQQLRGEEKESPFHLCLIGLTMDRQILYKRIEERVDLMLEQGLVEEVRLLLAQGYSLEHSAMQAIGYKEIIPYLQGEYDLTKAVYLLKRNTRRFAKRQLSWFRHMKEIEWVDVTKTNQIHEQRLTICGIIKRKFGIHLNPANFSNFIGGNQ